AAAARLLLGPPRRGDRRDLDCLGVLVVLRPAAAGLLGSRLLLDGPLALLVELLFELFVAVRDDLEGQVFVAVGAQDELDRFVALLELDAVLAVGHAEDRTVCCIENLRFEAWGRDVHLDLRRRRVELLLDGYLGLGGSCLRRCGRRRRGVLRGLELVGRGRSFGISLGLCLGLSRRLRYSKVVSKPTTDTQERNQPEYQRHLRLGL